MSEMRRWLSWYMCMKICSKYNKKKFIIFLTISIFLVILGNFFIWIGEQVSYVNNQGVLVDSPLLLLGGTFILIVGILSVISIMLLKITSSVQSYFKR
jgi:hypothetical protein